MTLANEDFGGPLLDRRGMLAAAATAPLVAGTGAAQGMDGAAATITIGLFVDAARTRIAPDVVLVHTSGYAGTGIGAARYALRAMGASSGVVPNAPPAVGVPERAAFRTADGRLFVLDEGRPAPQMFGATGDGRTDDTAAFAAMLSYARDRSLACRIPVGTYRLTGPLDVRGRHDGFPWHSMDFLGEQMDGVVLLFDYDGPHALRINDAPGSYSGMAGARIGRFTVMVAPGRRITQPVRVLNLLNGHCLDMRVRADWHRLDDAVELFRISAATQWSRFSNILVDPYNAPEDGRPDAQRGTGISIGHGYRDVPMQSSAISNNSFHDCTVNRCRIGFLSEASDATTTYSCRMVACGTGWIDRASYATVHINPWDEGATQWGFVFDSARVSDPNGTATHRTQFPQIVGGYVGSVRLAGVTGADLRCALNLLEVTPAAERCRAALLGQNGAVVRGTENDCRIERFDTTRRAYVLSAGPQPQIHGWRGGGEFWLDDAPGPGGDGGSGFSVYGPARPAGTDGVPGSGHAGFREEIAGDGSHRSYVWDRGPIGQERRVLVRRTTAQAQYAATPLLPDSDGMLPLGAPGARWRSIHLASSPVVTSDRAAKTAIAPVPDTWLDAWGQVRWVQFALRDDDGGRRHAGLVAQEIAGAFARHGIAPDSLGLLDRGTGAPGDGSADDTSAWGVRYDQCLAIEAAWQRREIARLDDRLARLEREAEAV